jgi:ABC-type bacteriocin/lantibiotic exporter with double-glycine peptidase domain
MRGFSIHQRCPYFLVIILLIIASLAACAGKDFSEIRQGIETRGHYIQNVPFYKQSEDTCGPAALAGVLVYWGRSIDLNEITAAIYVPKLRGTLPMDMENYARKAGFDTSSSAGTLDDLKTFLRRDVPVICLLDLGFGIYQKPHYIIAIGFDDADAVLIEHDGRRANSVMEYDTFIKAWKRAGYWMLVINPKGVEQKP